MVLGITLSFIIKSNPAHKEELIEVIKENTEPTCYERPEHNS